MSCNRSFSALLLFVVGAAAFGNALVNPPYTVDGLRLVEGGAALMSGAKADKVQMKADASGIELSPGAAAGSIVLSPIRTDFPFNEAIPSWNGRADPGTGFRVWMRASGGRISTPWLEAGTWGAVPDEVTTRIQVFDGGMYEIDTLLLNGAAEQIEFRIDLFRPDPAKRSPEVRLVAVSFTNTLGDRRLAGKHGDARAPISRDVLNIRTTESLSLPFCHQVVANKKWIGRICAPASVNMAIREFGSGPETQDVAAMLYDPVSDAFGVWHRSVQGAAQHGVRGYIRRFRNFDDVREHVRRGAVICASVRFRLGELRDPPRQYRRRGTEGHLIVIAGLAPGGKVIVNNSATKDYGRGELWRMDDLEKAWFDKGGVAYVFTGTSSRSNSSTSDSRSRKRSSE